MGLCESSTNQNNSNNEYSNLGVCGAPKTNNYRRRRINSDPEARFPTLDNLQPMRRHSRRFDYNQQEVCSNNSFNSNNNLTSNNENRIILISNQNSTSNINKPYDTNICKTDNNSSNNAPVNRINLSRYNLRSNTNSDQSKNRNLNNKINTNINDDSNISPNSLAFQRRRSMEYCNEFRNRYMNNQNPNSLLLRLAESVQRFGSQNYSEAEWEELKTKQLPQFIIDWRLVQDPQTKTDYWKSFGKIPINDKEVTKILFPNKNENNNNKIIDKNEKFWKKRCWLFQYLFTNFKSNVKENPTLVINRVNILEDSYQQFNTTKGFNLRRPIRIYFVDEIASDEGGVYRDWYSCLFKKIFSEEKKLFRKNTNKAQGGESYILYPKYPGMKLHFYEFFGQILIKAIVDMMTIENIVLNRILLKTVLKRKIVFEDLRYYDLELYNSLRCILESNVDLVNELKEIKFVWEVRDENGNKKEIELVQGGRNISLCDKNKKKFIEKVIYQETIKPYEEQINQIRKGVESLLGEEIKGIFSIEELNFMISGQQKIDIKDWQENTIYKGEYNKNHPVIKIFWEVIKGLTIPQLKKFLEFSTGSSSVPMDGFASLKGTEGRIQKFTIEPYMNFSAVDISEYEFRLIEAKTCFNRILLPKYRNKEEMEKGINIILNNDTSFFGLE